MAPEGDAALDRYVLTLYVAGETPRARRAIDTLKRLCDQELAGCQLDVVDVLQHPERAESERILATPTLIKTLPPPLRRLIGDLSNREKVLLGLDYRLRDAVDAAPEA